MNILLLLLQVTAWNGVVWCGVDMRFILNLKGWKGF